MSWLLDNQPNPNLINESNQYIKLTDLNDKEDIYNFHFFNFYLNDW
jgi:16S rRNA G527 N7-methylase RsmG